MKKLQKISAVRFRHGCNHFRVKFAVIGIGNTLLQLFLRKISEKKLHNLISHFSVSHTAQFFQRLIQLGDSLRYEKAPVL